jgi:hypothetical protein
MLQHRITGLLIGGACLTALAANARAERYVIGGNACVNYPGYQVGYDSQGIHSVPPNAAWVQCLDGLGVQDYSHISVNLTDGSTSDAVYCSIWGQDSAGNYTFGPTSGGSQQQQTGPFFVFAGLIPPNATQTLVVQCYLPAPTSVGASYLHSVSVTTRD